MPKYIRNGRVSHDLAETDWDLIVVDEAHRMAAHWFAVRSRKPAATSSASWSVGKTSLNTGMTSAFICCPIVQLGNATC